MRNVLALWGNPGGPDVGSRVARRGGIQRGSSKRSPKPLDKKMQCPNVIRLYCFHFAYENRASLGG